MMKLHEIQAQMVGLMARALDAGRPAKRFDRDCTCTPQGVRHIDEAFQAEAWALLEKAYDRGVERQER